MKINEKNLAAFATSPTCIDKEGWLVKKGEVNKGFQKRWFILKGNLLFYFEKKTDKEPTGVVILEGCTIELAEGEGQFGFKIVFHGQGNRTYVLDADSQESMEQWMKSLACASIDYMKVMVTELERQLEEMEGEMGQPVPPPRTRHNPFNRASPSSSHARSHSIRSAPGRTDLDSHRQKNSSSSVSFRDVHTSFGRKILQDLNEWKHKQRQLQQPLIQL
ncbi:sesquipedalian-1-like isoform X2 [Cimex lectularius]|uniref:PH domain-containing protein n=1 Tax=Cimex lectularius TaxID=79782 RepID=A0A8I6RAN8_CIMLE|nr:sesquipedalian-1-like isoform X2 [Cimex lectularius]